MRISNARSPGTIGRATIRRPAKTSVSSAAFELSIGMDGSRRSTGASNPPFVNRTGSIGMPAPYEPKVEPSAGSCRLRRRGNAESSVCAPANGGTRHRSCRRAGRPATTRRRRPPATSSRRCRPSDNAAPRVKPATTSDANSRRPVTAGSRARDRSVPPRGAEGSVWSVPAPGR